MFLEGERMARSRVIQTSISGPLEKEFDRYCEAKGYTKDAEAARSLFEFALRILNDDSKDAVLTNRELMEDIYRYVRRASTIVNLVHTQTLDEQKLAVNRTRSVEIQKEMNIITDVKVDEFLSAEHKKE